MNNRISAIAIAAIVAATLTGCGQSYSAPAAAGLDQRSSVAQIADSGTITTKSVAFEPAGAPSGTPAVVGTYISTVFYVSGTPCFNCVNGNTQGTYGTGDPLGYVNTQIPRIGILFVYMSVSYSGGCTVTVSLKQGTTTLATGSGNVNLSAGGVYSSELAPTRQSTWHGLANMSGKLVCGTTTVNQSGKMYFQ